VTASLPILVPDWRAPPGVRALCTTRVGGFSAAPWDSLNLGDHVADAPQDVARNRQHLRDAAELPAEPAWLRQVHGIDVADLDAAPAVAPTADAAVSASIGCVCAILTADCLPVLITTTDGTVVAAAHAGWRGLASGVLEATVQAVRARAATSATLQAWLGPGIGPRHFEVGEDVRAAFMADDAAASAAFVAGREGRWQCDLYQLARLRLARAGVVSISGGDLCTYADAARFYSHRRDVQHQGRASTGRMATLIWRQA
jgi:polyphenol oxidase